LYSFNGPVGIRFLKDPIFSDSRHPNPVRKTP